MTNGKLSLVGSSTDKVKEATVGVELSMFGAPTTLVMDVGDIGSFQNVLDAMETQGYLDGVHRATGKHMRAYKYPGMLILKMPAESTIVAASSIPKTH